ncbi:MAG TPA: hypothetical protein VGD92_07355 [Sphingobacteriaceae bacterium]
MTQLEFSGTTLISLLGSLLLGLCYAWLLYRSPAIPGRRLRNALSGLRALAVAAIAFLLFAPLIRTTSRTLEKPLIILAQDNSASIGLSRPEGFDSAAYARDLRAVERALSKDYEVRTFSFGAAPESGLRFDFGGSLTNMSSVYGLIRDRFSNRNIGAVVMASDGIYNQGGNPQYDSRELKAPVYTIALGDTIPRKDILISNVSYNQIAYLGNRFRIEVSVEAFQSRGHRGRLTVRDKDGAVFSAEVPVNSQEFRRTIPVTLPARAKGVQKYTISVSGFPGELSLQNNTQSIYVEVVDGRQQVLILAHAPHPDIAAIKSSIERNENYEVRVALAGEMRPEDIARAGLVILHQVPGINRSDREILRLVADKPVLFVLGAQSNIPLFNTSQDLLAITSPGATQEVLPGARSDFYAFSLSTAFYDRLAGFGPLLAPFGSYDLKGPAAVLLAQQVGKVTGESPLLAFSASGNRKTGILAGEGIWRWRLEEFQETGEHAVVDELIGKTVQYLSGREDRRKFRVYTNRNTFDENQRVVLNAELYNDAYELVNTPDVPLNVRDQAGKAYSYVFSRSGNAYTLDAGVLPPGEYTFTSRVRYGNRDYASEGRFVVVQQQAEFRQTTANHQLMNAMAMQNGGRMLYPEQVSTLPGIIRANGDIRTVSYENRTYREIIDKKWVFFLLLALLTLEWVLRKRNGAV